MSFFDFSTDLSHDQDGNSKYRAKRMTYRSPSSASSSSRSTISSFSSSTSSNTADDHNCWTQNVSVREIYKTGSLRLLSEKKGLFRRQDKAQGQSFWCVFCIHDESAPFLELYADHKASLTHKPERIISLINCQHVTPNISIARHSSSFTLTLSNEVHQFSTENDSDMRDWISTLRTKVQDLQRLNDDRHEYVLNPSRTAAEPLSHTLHSTALTEEAVDEGISVASETIPKKTPLCSTKRPVHFTAATPRNPMIAFEQPLSSPPACLAPPVPTLIPTQLVSMQTNAPPVPPRPRTQMDDLISFQPLVVEKPVPPPRSSNRVKAPTIREAPQSSTLPNFAEVLAKRRPENHYGRLFVRTDPMDPFISFQRETRSATASPALSDRSCSSTASEPTSPKHVDEVKSKAAGLGNQVLSTLRQQQIDRLRQEMCNPDGVSVKIRRSHCSDITLVDCFGSVWVAGWKQSEHPYMQSLFHLGDQVVAVNGIFISKAADVRQIAKDTLANKYVVFNIQRISRGRALVLTRSYDGQDLGFTREGSTAEIRFVDPNGLASQSGLPTKALTCAGDNLCNWVITEINNRPLNWFFKEHEIEDRLNAVGKEVSIVVLPSDLVIAIKKQLKTVRGYKDFLVQ